MTTIHPGDRDALVIDPAVAATADRPPQRRAGQRRAWSLPETLRATAAARAHRTAVTDGQTTLSYDRLMRAVDALAGRLLDAGAGAGDRVLCALPRGVPAVVAQAAVLTAGLVYVPVDPDAPARYAAAVAASTRPVMVIAEPGAVGAWPGPVLTYHTATVLADAETRARPVLGRATLDLPAYVVHTSGSSGPPKGVLIGHRAMAAATAARWRFYSHRVRGFLMVSPMTVDSSLAGIWWTLTQGGLLRLAPPGPAGAVGAARNLLRQLDPAISHILLTPSLYAQVLDDMPPPLTWLTHVVLAGEPCPPALVDAHHAAMPDVALVNEYGPAEAAAWCTAGRLHPGHEVTIGAAIPDTEVRIADGPGRPVPAGEVGEICISGPQLADGYLDDPELTARRFPADPLARHRRLYRTGDMGWQRRDGQIVLVGRADEQIKRGHRIDQQGIATVLRHHPDVADAAVTTHPRGRSGEPTLAAYVVPTVDRDATAAALRASWAGIVDEVAATDPADDGFDISGWTSGYTGGGLPAAAIAEWVDATVALLAETAPATVLDLGCGNGLPLLRLAADCHRYVGLDISTETLRRLDRTVRRRGLSPVELRVGEARDVTQYAGAGIDLVACTSVSQYFPDAGYLRDIVAGALAAIGPAGRVVIGDVRDLSLLPAFGAAVALAHAEDDRPAGDLAIRLRRRIDGESQLLVDPAWFVALAAELGVPIEIRPRRGWRRTEMNDFRYDVVLYGTEACRPVEVDWHDWDGDPHPRRWAAPRSTEPVGVRGIRDARAAGYVEAATRLLNGTADTAAGVRRVVAATEATGVHPETVALVARTLGRRCRLSRAAGAPDGTYDAVFLPPDDDPRPPVPVLAPPVRPTAGPLSTDPVRRHAVAEAALTLPARLRRHAARSLASHERPAVYVVVPELPLAAHGKVDLTALPHPSPPRPHLSTRYTAPATDLERTVAEVWAQVLGLAEVGVDDDFAELGGDSLMAARCATRLTGRLGRPVPLGAVLSVTTVRALAARLAAEQSAAETPPPQPESLQ